MVTYITLGGITLAIAITTGYMLHVDSRHRQRKSDDHR